MDIFMEKKTIKDAILASLEDIRALATYKQIFKHIIDNKYYNFGVAKTPASTVSASLGGFIRNNDSRVKRVKSKNGKFSYYLTKYEEEIEIDNNQVEYFKETKIKKSFQERDLHILLSTYLKNQNTYSKTIFHEKSKKGGDSHQKWIHPDMVSINFLKLKTKASQTFIKATNRLDTFKISSYELKKEINTDYELKKTFFQAVSNSSWANYGYLVAYEFSDLLYDEMKRLNQSFGIGIIEIRSNAFESKVLFPASYRELDFNTIDKLCKINRDFEKFIEQTEKLLTASQKYIKSSEKELEDFSDNYFTNDADLEKYCKEKNISYDLSEFDT
jgi:hypothetical protein